MVASRSTWWPVWLALSGVGGLVMAAAGVGPQEAASNLSQWAEVVGLHRAAEWLAPTAADKWGMALGAAVIAFSMFMVFRSLRGRRAQALVRQNPNSQLPIIAEMGTVYLFRDEDSVEVTLSSPITGLCELTWEPAEQVHGSHYGNRLNFYRRQKAGHRPEIAITYTVKEWPSS